MLKKTLFFATTAWVLAAGPAAAQAQLQPQPQTLSDPAAASDPFFHLAPEGFLPILVILATAATIAPAPGSQCFSSRG